MKTTYVYFTERFGMAISVRLSPSEGTLLFSGLEADCLKFINKNKEIYS